MDEDPGDTCGICLGPWAKPIGLPCGHTFCDSCLSGWRSRYGVGDKMRNKCPNCRAQIPPTREMVGQLHFYMSDVQKYEEMGTTNTGAYKYALGRLQIIEKDLEGWDGTTILGDGAHVTPPVSMPISIGTAATDNGIKTIIRWIEANEDEDRVNARVPHRFGFQTILQIAVFKGLFDLSAILLQLGADVNLQAVDGGTAFSMATKNDQIARMLLSWGAEFFDEYRTSREKCSQRFSDRELLLSELGGRRCEIVNLTSRPDLNGKTCVADEYHRESNQYKVTLETKTKEVLVISPENLKRRDRTPKDPGYYIKFKNDRTIRHEFESAEECQAFVAALKTPDGAQTIATEEANIVTEEAKASAEQAAAELLAELGLDALTLEGVSSSKKKKQPAKKTKGKKKRGKK